MNEAAVPREGTADGRSLRISYLFPQFPLATETFAISDIAALRDLGHDVVVHTIKPRRALRAAERRQSGLPPDLAILRPTAAGVSRWPSLLWKRRADVLLMLRILAPYARRQPRTVLATALCLPRIIEIAEEIRRRDPDVVHVFWARHASLVLPVLRDAGSRSLRSIFVGAYDLVADDFLVQSGAESANVAFTHAETNRPFLDQRIPADRSRHVIHRGIPLPKLDPSIVRDPFRWLTASALVEAKRVDLVIREFAEARKHWPDLRLDVCGQGPERGRLEGLCRDLGCADAVRFAGHIPREKLFAMMQRSHLFLLLSQKESERLPNVLKEALWCGCAVLASRTPGIEELIPDASYGHVIDDDAKVAMAVESIMQESPEEAELRRMRAQRMIASNFSSETSMAKYVDAWKSELPPAPSAGQ